jgi:hypothetical protein
VYDTSREAIRRFAAGRSVAIWDSIEFNLRFNRNERFAVTLTVGAGGNAVMHSRPVNEGETVTGNYFIGTEIMIKAVPNPGERVDFWWVDGLFHYGNHITLSSDATVFLFFVK